MPGLGLDGLDQEGGRVRGDGLLQGVGVAEGDDDESGREGAEILAVEGLRREADDRDRAAVEVVGAGDDLGPVLGNALLLVGPLAGRLDGRFDGLGAGVHGQDHLVASQVAELLGQQRPLVVAERARSEGQLAGLLDRARTMRGDMALVDGRIAAQEVEVLAALDIVDPDPLPSVITASSG